MPWGNVDIIVGQTSQSQIDFLHLVAAIKRVTSTMFCFFYSVKSVLLQIIN